MVFGISGGAWILWHKGVKNSGFVTTIFGRNIPSTWFEEILYLFKKNMCFFNISPNTYQTMSKNDFNRDVKREKTGGFGNIPTMFYCF